MNVASTEIVIPHLDNLPAAFASPELVEEMIASVERQARAHVPDVSTNKGRLAIASIAARVASSKTALDAAGKDLTEDYRKAVDKVNAERRRIRDRLDALKVEVRAPLTEYEEAEDRRKEALERRLDELVVDQLRPGEWGSAEIATEISRIENIPLDELWQEMLAAAATRKDATLFDLRAQLADARQREADAAELTRLRAEQAERDRLEAKRIADQIALDNQRNAEAREAERLAEIGRIQFETDRRIAQEAQERAERDAREQIAAAERRAQEAQEAAARAEREAEARQAAAVAAERQRAADERARAEAEQAKRDADKRRRTMARKSLAAALGPIIAKALVEAGGDYADEAAANAVADALLAGAIPRVTVTL